MQWIIKMFEIKISNSERERSHTMNLGTELEDKMYIKLESIITEFIDGSNIPNLK